VFREFLEEFQTSRRDGVVEMLREIEMSKTREVSQNSEDQSEFFALRLLREFISCQAFPPLLQGNSVSSVREFWEKRTPPERFRTITNRKFENERTAGPLSFPLVQTVHLDLKKNDQVLSNSPAASWFRTVGMQNYFRSHESNRQSLEI